MKTILVPTDFSDLSLNAARYAADLALKTQASVHLVHVLPVPAVVGGLPISGNVYDELNEQAETALDNLRNYVRVYAGDGLLVDAEVVVGNVADRLATLCAGYEVFAVVMGTEGDDVVKHFLLGHQTIDVMRRLTCPVFIVPEGCSFRGLRTVGLACDLKDVPETVPFAQLQLLLTAFHPAVQVLTVRAKETEPTVAELENTAWLQDMLKDFSPSFHVIPDTNFIKGLNAYISQHQLDLLVVVPKKLGLADTIFSRSHSRLLAFHPVVPVVAVHGV